MLLTRHSFALAAADTLRCGTGRQSGRSILKWATGSKPTHSARFRWLNWAGRVSMVKAIHDALVRMILVIHKKDRRGQLFWAFFCRVSL